MPPYSVVLVGRLFYLMVIQHDYYEKQAIDNQTRSTSVGADRGTIYDCNMNELAKSITVENVFLDPEFIHENEEDLDLIASGLSELLDLDGLRLQQGAHVVEAEDSEAFGGDGADEGR